MKKLFRSLSEILIFCVDILTLMTAFFLAYFVRKDIFPIFFSPPNPQPHTFYFKYYYLIFLYVFILIYQKTYFSRFDLWNDLKAIIKSALMWIVLSFSFLAIFKFTSEASRSILILMGLISIFLIILNRFFLKLILYKIGVWRLEGAMLVDSLKSYKSLENLVHQINKSWYTGFHINTIVFYMQSKINIKKLNTKRKFYNIKNLTENNLINIIKKNQIDELFAYNIFDKNLEKMLKLHVEQIVEIKYIPSFQNIKVLNIKHQNIGHVFTLLFRNNLASPFNLLLKKFFDFIVALITIILLSPLFIIIALLVKLSSKGPLLYKAKRVGKKHKTIYIYKFRTMYADAETRLKELLQSNPKLKKEFEQTFKLKNDPRITPLGKFFRKYSLDEIPQLFNVLKFDLSLVGPRPIVKNEIRKYGEHFNEVIVVAPGITGLWQVSGRNDTSYNQRIQFDIFYIRNWSLWLDIKILFMTIPTVIKGSGAY